MKRIRIKLNSASKTILGKLLKVCFNAISCSRNWFIEIHILWNKFIVKDFMRCDEKYASVHENCLLKDSNLY